MQESRKRIAKSPQGHRPARSNAQCGRTMRKAGASPAFLI